MLSALKDAVATITGLGWLTPERLTALVALAGILGALVAIGALRERR